MAKTCKLVANCLGILAVVFLVLGGLRCRPNRCGRTTRSRAAAAAATAAAAKVNVRWATCV